MRIFFRLAAWPLVAAWGLAMLGAANADAGQDDDGPEFFERKVRPILVERCYSCHSQSARHLQGDLALDARAGILKGGESGPAVVPGKPEESLLVEAVRYQGDTQMPPDGKLPIQEIAVLSEWVRRGAPLPEDGSAPPSKSRIDFEAGRRFWSFQPLHHAGLPASRPSDWPRGPIDAWVLAALESRGLAPSPPADRRTLIRRVSFDLVGLPPSAEEVEQFVADASPSAYEHLVERLLASPHYGERWARFWLDLSRYADANETSLEKRPRAWLYRDWIIRAFNADLPYDRFVALQLAADLIPGTEPADLAALGFFGVGPEYFKELKLSPTMIETIVADEREERIDALGRTFLGLSLACARCHDHKFDPVSAEDYYALAGVLASTRLTDRYVIPKPQASVVQRAREQVTQFEARLEKLKSAKAPTPQNKEQMVEIKQQIQRIEQQTPNYATAQAHGVDDAALLVLADGPDHTKLEYHPGQSLDMRVQIRGNPAKPGRVVPRRFLTVLSAKGSRPFGKGSGRRELAEAMIHDAAPLAARVIVNRVWKFHFGSGLVETVSDFGTQGARPSHPQLLDDLALRFIEHGWSLKWLHREILLSATYRQSSAYDAGKLAA
ncbi:MAG TPA: PSD1 and planctomycete cytochrome C domain-containing protein, partial [Pirellulales bacterium]